MGYGFYTNQAGTPTQAINGATYFYFNSGSMTQYDFNEPLGFPITTVYVVPSTPVNLYYGYFCNSGNGAYTYTHNVSATRIA